MRWRSTSAATSRDVARGRVVAAAQQRERPGALGEADRPARRGAVLDQRREVGEPVLVRVARRVGQADA